VPNTEANPTVPSYPRKRVSSGFFFQILFWIPAGVYPGENRGRNDDEEGIRTQVDLKSTCFRNPSPSRRGRIQFFVKEISPYALCILKVNPMNSINLSREMGSLFHRDPSNSTNSSNPTNLSREMRSLFHWDSSNGSTLRT
jgi:hypothetical protein